MFTWINDFILDFRHAGRSLIKSFGFTFTAILTLALGIGASVTVFSILNKDVFEPLPYPDSNRIVQLWIMGSGRLFSTPDYCDLREQAHSFDAIAAYSECKCTLAGNPPEPLSGLQCTASLAHVLGFEPILGRWFSDDEEKDEGKRVVVLSNQLWERRYSADPHIVGKSIHLSGNDFVVLGVLPKELTLYMDNTEQMPDFYQPLVLHPEKDIRDNWWLSVVARIKPDCTRAQSITDLTTFTERLLDTTSRHSNRPPSVIPLSKTTSSIVGLYAMQVAVLCILALSCASVGGMLLARAVHRKNEYAICIALGACRNHILRMVLTECFILVMLSAITGLLSAYSGLELLAWIEQSNIHFELDMKVFLFTCGLIFLTTLFAGLPAIISISATDIITTLKDMGTQQTGSLVLHRQYRTLVIIQIALTFPLINIALLLSGSYYNIVRDSQPFITDHVFTASIDFSGKKYAKSTAQRIFFEQLCGLLSELPGTTATAIANKLPFIGGKNRTLHVPDSPYSKNETDSSDGILVEISSVSHGYFSAIGLNLIRGRLFTETDAHSKPQSVIINRAFADHLWPGQDPVGKFVQPMEQVIGVVDDARQWGAEEPAVPEIYYLASENWFAPPIVHIVVRTKNDVHHCESLIRQKLQMMDPDLALSNVRTMKDVFRKRIQMRRLLTCLVNGFMGIAILITAIGIYGTLAFHVEARTREIGIRIALGSTSLGIVRLVAGQIIRWLMAGLVLGLLLTFSLGELLRSMLYETSAHSPLHLLLSIAIVFGVAALACWIPARRASKMNPTDAFRAG